MPGLINLSRADFEQVHDLRYQSTGIGPAQPRFDWRGRASQDKPLSSGKTAKVYKRRADPTHRSVMLGEPFFHEIQAYESRFLPMLEAEQQEEEAVVQERLSSWSVQRLKSEGYCITDMSAFWMEQTSFGHPVAAFSLGPGVTLPEHHRFDNGIQVLITHLDPLEEAPYRGRVLGASSTQLRVSFQDRFDLRAGGKPWRLDVGRSDIAFERMRNAIRQLSLDPLVLESAPHADDREIVLRGTALRDILLRAFKTDARFGKGQGPILNLNVTAQDDILFDVDEATASSPHEPSVLQDGDDVSYVAREKLDHPGHFAHRSDGAFTDDMRIMSWARRYSRPDPIPIDGDPPLLGLNATQIRAAAMMIGQRASLVQGPPGTGKTKTIIETIKLLKREFDVSTPILVCTYTNVAVDNLVEGFSNAGLKPVRVGSEGMIRERLQRHSLQAKLSEHPDSPQLETYSADLTKAEAKQQSIIKEVKRLRAKHSNPSARVLQTIDNMKASIAQVERQIKAISIKISVLKGKMIKDVFFEADVLCSTSLTAVHPHFRHVDFPIVFLDEASMSTEPASLIPLMKGSKHVALIGDHKQLPPIILSPEARENGLAISLFERLTEEGVVPSIMLDVQYRMHPSIARFPSREFYGMALHDGMVDALGNVPHSLSPPNSALLIEDPTSGHRPSVVFLDHSGPESSAGRSKINWTDATVVCSVIEDILLSNNDIMGSDIGVIAPYAGQVMLLSRLLTTDPRFQVRFKNNLGDHRAMQLANVEVKTVDGFEGREKEVIIFSTVRNNSGGYIGFLSDRRRLNVGLTRAKRGLFVIGSLRTLGAANTGERKVKQPLTEISSLNTESLDCPPFVRNITETRTRSKGGVWARYIEFLKAEGLVLPLQRERIRNMGVKDTSHRVNTFHNPT